MSTVVVTNSVLKTELVDGDNYTIELIDDNVYYPLVLDDTNLNLMAQDIVATAGVILKSPNGTKYRLKVDDAGSLSTEVV
jgi:hypothetical protein